MKQADSSLLFPLLLKALKRCVSPRVYTIHKILPFGKVRIYGDIHVSPDHTSSHKDTPISVLFWTILLGKLINSVDPQGNSSSHQGLRQQQRK